MTRKAITTSHAVLSCDVCGRTLLRGERADPFITGGTRRLVCELCIARATNEGWIREGADDVAVRRAGTGGRRSLLGRLRRPPASGDPGRSRRTPASGEPGRSRRSRRTAEPAEEQPVWAEEPVWEAEPPAPPPPPAGPPPPAASPPPPSAVPPPAAAPPPPAESLPPAARPESEPEPSWAGEAVAPSPSEAPPPAPAPEEWQRDGAEAAPAPAWPGGEQGEASADETPPSRREVHAVPADESLKIGRALEVFNVSPHPRTVGGVARSLGAPLVTARPSPTEGSIVTIVVAWELCWYRYEVDLADEAAGVRVVEQGAELEELAPEDQNPNVAADDRGALVLA